MITSTVVAAIVLGASAGNQSSASTKVSGGAYAGSLQPRRARHLRFWRTRGGPEQWVCISGERSRDGQANVQDLSLTRAMDSTSVDLLKKVTLGTHDPAAIVIATSNASSATMKYELTNVLVTSVELGEFWRREVGPDRERHSELREGEVDVHGRRGSRDVRPIRHDGEHRLGNARPVPPDYKGTRDDTPCRPETEPQNPEPRRREKAVPGSAGASPE